MEKDKDIILSKNNQNINGNYYKNTNNTKFSCCSDCCQGK